MFFFFLKKKTLRRKREEREHEGSVVEMVSGPFFFERSDDGDVKQHAGVGPQTYCEKKPVLQRWASSRTLAMPDYRKILVDHLLGYRLEEDVATHQDCARSREHD